MESFNSLWQHVSNSFTIITVSSWVAAYIANYTQEWYYRASGNAKWGITNIYNGCCGGDAGHVLYIIFS